MKANTFLYYQPEGLVCMSIRKFVGDHRCWYLSRIYFVEEMVHVTVVYYQNFLFELWRLYLASTELG